MASIGQTAKDYKPMQLKNIADLEVVRVDYNINEETFGEGDDKFTANIIVVNDEKYRVPATVLKSLKAILEIKPNLKTFQVSKKGEGIKTTYTVIPIE